MHPLRRYPAPSAPPTGESVAPTIDLDDPGATDPGRKPSRFIVAVAAAALFGALVVQVVPWAAQRSSGDDRSPRDVAIAFFDVLGNDPDSVAALLVTDDPACIAGSDPQDTELISHMMLGAALSDLDILRETGSADGESVAFSGRIRVDGQSPSAFRVELTTETAGLGADAWRVCNFSIG